MTLTKLIDSPAVKENRKGLEEGDDLTFEIENFIKEKIREVINKIENITRDKEKEERFKSANSKLKELSKFLSKQDLKFKLELKELQKRFSNINDAFTVEEDNDIEIPLEKDTLYRKALPEDSSDVLIKGRWIEKEEYFGDSDVQVINPQPETIPEFIPDPDGEDVAVIVGARRKINAQEKRKKKGIQVLMSNMPENEVNVNFSSNDEPVSDRDLYQQGIVWINRVNPIIVNAIERKDNSTLLNDMIANYVFLIVAQYYAQKEFESQPEFDRGDPFSIFRRHFFNLQKSIRQDEDVKYFEA